MSRSGKERKEKSMGDNKEGEQRGGRGILEGYRQTKKVSFKVIDKDVEEEVMVKVRELLKIEIGNLREIWEKKIKELEEKIINIEKELEEQRTGRRRRGSGI